MCCPAKRQVEHRFNSTHGAELTSCSGLGYLLASTQLLKTSWSWHCSRDLFLSFKDNPFSVCSSHLDLARPPRMFKELPPGKTTRWGHNEEPGVPSQVEALLSRRCWRQESRLLFTLWLSSKTSNQWVNLSIPAMNCIIKNEIQEAVHREFSGGPLAKTQYCQCRGPGFNPWWGN